MLELNVTYRKLRELKPNPRNARTHAKKQLQQIADSIEAFGFANPVLIDAGDIIVAGHGRVEAAKLLGLEKVPTIRLEHLSSEQLRAYVIADNKLAENAGWDEELLAIELQYLTELEVDFDATITGFAVAEIDLLIEGLAPDEEDAEADALPVPEPERPATSEIGDLWLLGEHRLLCGDATTEAAFQALMADEVAQMVFVDPPYNVPVNGHVCGSGAIRHREFAMASGEMSEAAFTAFLETSLAHLATHSMDGAIHYVCMDWRHIYPLLTAGRAVYTEFKNLCVWNKDNGGMGSFYRSKHELVFVFKHGSAPHQNNFALGEHGRYRTNVWDYPGVNSLGADRLAELAMHPTVKPVAMVADAILDCSTRGAIVLDSFAGSGTTIIAAEKTGRRAYAMELDPVYVDTAIRRWEAYSGEVAIHAENGLSFAEITTQRHDGTGSREASDGCN